MKILKVVIITFCCIVSLLFVNFIIDIQFKLSAPEFKITKQECMNETTCIYRHNQSIILHYNCFDEGIIRDGEIFMKEEQKYQKCEDKEVEEIEKIKKLPVIAIDYNTSMINAISIKIKDSQGLCAGRNIRTCEKKGNLIVCDMVCRGKIITGEHELKCEKDNETAICFYITIENISKVDLTEEFLQENCECIEYDGKCMNNYGFGYNSVDGYNCEIINTEYNLFGWKKSRVYDNIRMPPKEIWCSEYKCGDYKIEILK